MPDRDRYGAAATTPAAFQRRGCRRTWRRLCPELRSQDGQCTGLTQTELTAVHDSSAYTDRVRLRDILGDHRSYTSPVTTAAEAEHEMRFLRVGALPVVDEHGSALGVLALSR
ncbi:hypothetical protein [Streptomyces sp. ISL-36]|uniref:hypothetical protein n=1 Tax=Streptomyces sp. ISL-36 TaxID=2819182 RepID=UPI0027E4CCEB|nr:hypothetical protein [Streptomyces sp. ISL-36]